MKNLPTHQKEEAPTSGDQLADAFTTQTRSAAVKREALEAYVQRLRERNASWLNRLTAGEQERKALAVFERKQAEALEQVLEDRNQGLEIVGQAELAFIREVCESLLVSTRSHMQLHRSRQFQERFLQLNEELESLNQRFAALVEAKLEQLEGAKDHLRRLHQQQLDHMLRQWEETYAQVLDDFAAILEHRQS